MTDLPKPMPPTSEDFVAALSKPCSRTKLLIERLVTHRLIVRSECGLRWMLTKEGLAATA